MEGWPGPALARAGARLAALALLLMGLLPIILPAPPRASAAGCLGDEQILLAPAEPHIGSSLIVAAVSHFAHEDVLMLGPDGPIEVTRASIGDRFIWQATVVPTRAGEHLFAFGVASGGTALVTCADARALVAEASPSTSAAAPDEGASAADPSTGVPSALVALLNPYGRDAMTSHDQAAATTGQTAPADSAAVNLAPPSNDGAADPRTPTRTPRPTRTPTRRTETDNGNDNDNGNANDNAAEPTPTKTPTYTRTPSPTRVPTDTRTPTPTRTPRGELIDPGTPTDTPEPTSTRTPRPDPSDTPTRTPRPDPPDTPVPSPTATRTPRPDPTDTPSPTPSPTMAPPSIADWSPVSATCGQSLTIRGQRFGSSRDAVNGRVTIDGVFATVNSWSDSQIDVRVPLTARPGNDRELVIVVAGQLDRSSHLRVSC